MDRFPHHNKYGLIQHDNSLWTTGIYYFIKQFNDGTGYWQKNDEDSELLQQNI